MKWLWLIILGLPFSLQATTYYVDSVGGSDVNTGTSATAAWKTLQNVNEPQFRPGDRILLKAGGAWQGQLAPKSSGSEGAPILIDRYGEGAMPRIDGAGTVEDAVRLYNVEEIEVHNLEITNHGDKVVTRRGVHIFIDNFGTARHIVLADCYIHDVNGVNDWGWQNGGIIYRANGDKKPSRFDGLTIERNIVWKVDKSGLYGVSYHEDRTRWFPSLHVIIRDNYVDDTGGDSLVPRGTDGALIEHNVATKCNMRNDHSAVPYAGGIWPQNADNTLFILNESSFCRDTHDGEGFNSDFNTHNSAFRFNYGHDNEGGFMLICTPGELKGGMKDWLKTEENIGNTGTVVQYNISRHDHTRLFNIDGGLQRATIENNAFYIAPGFDLQLLISDWEGWPTGVTFKENTFYIEGTLRFGHSTAHNKDGTYQIGSGWGPAKEIVFEGNKYLGKTVDRPEDAKGVVEVSVSAPQLDWNEPTFDPSHPEGFRQFITEHRKWMAQLFKQQFGKEPQ
jgi:hypothetical protein